MNKIRKVISLVLSIGLLASMFSLPVAAVEEKDPVEQFIDSVLAIENKEEFIDLVFLFQEVDDPNGLSAAYAKAFGALGDSQQDRILAFGVTTELVSQLAVKANSYEVSRTDLKKWLGIKGEPDRVALAEFINKFRSYIINTGADADKIQEGFLKMDRVFTMLSLAKNDKGTISVKFLKTDRTYGQFTLIDSKVDSLISMVNVVLKDKISDTASVKLAIKEIPNYYNNTNKPDQKLIFDYLNKYGFIEVDPGGGNGGGSGGGNGGGKPDDKTDETITDDETPAGTPSFVDLEGYEWAQTAINSLATKGVINGRTDTVFDPAGQVTRAEYAAMLARMLNLKGDVSKLTFTDVKSTDWFAADVAAVFEADIIKGRSLTKFNPLEKISREEMATIIGRILVQKAGQSYLTEADSILQLGNFSDADTISSWATLPSALAVSKNIVTGIKVNDTLFFYPTQNASRAECAVMLFGLAANIDSVVVTQ